MTRSEGAPLYEFIASVVFDDWKEIEFIYEGNIFIVDPHAIYLGKGLNIFQIFIKNEI
jgi:hypothetical protein